MSARLKLGAQALAVALVAGLLALLVWKVTHGNGGGVAAKIDRGHIVAAPNFVLSRLDRPGGSSSPRCAGRRSCSTSGRRGATRATRKRGALEHAWRDHDGRVVVLGIDANDATGDARKFMRKHGMTYPIVHDNKLVTEPRYGVANLPETFFVDPRGRVVAHVTGQVTADDLRLGIEQALKA